MKTLEITRHKLLVIVDVVFCCLFVPMMFLLMRLQHWITYYPLYGTVLVAYCYGLYFGVKRINFPKLVMHRRYWSVAGYLALLIAITCLFILAFPTPDDCPSIDDAFPGLRQRMRSQTIWFSFFIFSGYGLAVSLLAELSAVMMKHKWSEHAKVRAELALFKAQINPHFMFNTLNTLYGMIVAGSDKTEDAFVKFSNLIKYSYTTINHDTIELWREIDYIGMYLDLQRLRLNSHTRIEWNHHICNPGLQIPPMILITFVENAVKYGASASHDSVITITAHESDGMFVFTTHNPILHKKQPSDPSMGIDNCRSRLNLLYPDRHKIEVIDDGRYFTLRFEITLDHIYRHHHTAKPAKQ